MVVRNKTQGGTQLNVDLGHGNDVGHGDVGAKGLEAPAHLLQVPKFGSVLDFELEEVGALTSLRHVVPVPHVEAEGQVLL